MTETAETVALYGVHCGTPAEHHTDGRVVYASSPHLVEMQSLAKNTCYEIVVSRDGGNTWEPYVEEVEAAALHDPRKRSDAS